MQVQAATDWHYSLALIGVEDRAGSTLLLLSPLLV